MKVTSQQMYDTLLAGISQQLQTQSTATAQISSGKRYTRPSQDGMGYKQSLDIRHVQSGLSASLGAISTAKSRLSASQSALSQMQPLIQRAQTIAVQQANATLSPSERQAAVAEVSTLRDQLLALANQKFSGEYLFSGTATGKPAYSSAFSAGTAQYAADTTASQNTGITNVVQTANPNAANDTYAITVDPATNQVTSVTNSAGTNVLQGGSVALTANSQNTLNLTNGVTLVADTGTLDGTAGHTAGGTVTVSGANAAGSLHYNGNAQDRTVAITPTQTVLTNVRGDSAAFTQAFSSMKALQDALNANNVAGIKSSITQLNTAGNSMSELTAEVGGRLHSIGLQDQTYNAMKSQTDQLLSQQESTDIPATVTKLTQAQTALQAAYKVTSNISNISLVNYLK